MTDSIETSLTEGETRRLQAIHQANQFLSRHIKLVDDAVDGETLIKVATQIDNFLKGEN